MYKFISFDFTLGYLLFDLTLPLKILFETSDINFLFLALLISFNISVDKSRSINLRNDT